MDDHPLTCADPLMSLSPDTPRPRRFDLVVFDWDGTLFDSTALIVRCIQSACADIGVAVPSAERAGYVIGLGLHDALQHAVPGLPEARYPELGRRYRHHYAASQHDLVLFPGTLVMFADSTFSISALTSGYDAAIRSR